MAEENAAHHLFLCSLGKRFTPPLSRVWDGLVSGVSV